MVDLQQMMDMGAFGVIENIFTHLTKSNGRYRTEIVILSETIISCFETCREFRCYSKKFITRDNLDWEYISRKTSLPEDFISDYEDYLDWDEISSGLDASEDLIWKFRYKFNWKLILESQIISDELLKKLIHGEFLNTTNELFWEHISRYVTLSEDFIHKYADELNWKIICEYQLLSESLMEKFSDRLDWYNVSTFQNLSELFISKYFDKIDYHGLYLNLNMSETLVNELIFKFHKNISVQ